MFDTGLSEHVSCQEIAMIGRQRGERFVQTSWDLLSGLVPIQVGLEGP